LTDFFVDTNEKEKKEKLILTAFPNPSSSENLNLRINLKKPTIGNITLINTIGQAVSNQITYLNAGLNTLKLKTENISPGIYFLHFHCEQGEGTIKVLIR
ncbi:MAG: T9SS type A sorting domain-containing protein, partial [Bacteroidota bacterium]